MENKVIVPSPQFRYLDPYKNRTYQYDTKHSNYFLSHYVNQLLNVVGNDVIVRGLDVVPEVNAYRTGVDFRVSPGSLIQDLTYFEIPSETILQMEDVNNFAGYQLIVYTSWRYIETVYDNPLKIEATLYNPKTQKIITQWDNHRNRIILGMYSFDLDSENLITEVRRQDGDVFFESLNITQNGNFDNSSFKFWTAVNAKLQILPSGGVENTPCLRVHPLSNESQGIAQVLQTKSGYTYEVTFRVRSEELTPLQALVLDGSSIYNLAATEITHYDTITSRGWDKHNFRFKALSSNSTLFLLKKSTTLEDSFDLDSIQCMEYLQTRKSTDINQIKLVDGGVIYANPSDPNPIAPPEPDKDPEADYDVSVREWSYWTLPGRRNYPIPNFREMDSNTVLVFLDTVLLNPRDYQLLPSTQELQLEFDPDADQHDLVVVSVGISGVDGLISHRWDTVTRVGVTEYVVADDITPLGDPTSGTYFVFYGTDLLDPNDYVVDVGKNKIILSNAFISGGIPLNVLFFESNKIQSFRSREWIIPTEKDQRLYFLSGNYPTSSESGFFMVFLGSTKLNAEDYSVEGSFFRLNFDPTSDDEKLTIFYLGAVSDQISSDIRDQYKIKSEVVGVVPNQVRYSIPGWVETETQPNTLVFYDSDILSVNDYVIGSSGTLDLSFFPEAKSEISVCLINSKEPHKDVIRRWNIQIQPDVLVYTPQDRPFADPELGKYLVFYDASLLNPSDYLVDYTSNRISLTKDLIQNLGYLTIYYVDSSAVPDLTIQEWNLTTTDQQTTYLIEGNSSARQDDPGFYMVFYESNKLSQSDFSVRGDSFRLGFEPEGGSNVRILYVGYRERQNLPDLPPAPVVSLYFQSWEFGSVTEQNRYVLSGIVTPEHKSDLVFYDSELLDQDSYFINSDGQLILGFQPPNLGIPIDVLRVGDDGLSGQRKLLSRWEVDVHPDVTTYSPVDPLINPSRGSWLVFYGKTLLDHRDYVLDSANNVIELDSSLTLVEGSKLTVLLFDGDVSTDVEIREWNIKTGAGVTTYGVGGLSTPNSEIQGFYLVFYDYRKLNPQDFRISENKFELVSPPSRSGISVNILYVGGKR